MVRAMSFFPCAALARYEDRRVACGDPERELEYVPHGVALPDHGAKGFAIRFIHLTILQLPHSIPPKVFFTVRNIISNKQN